MPTSLAHKQRVLAHLESSAFVHELRQQAETHFLAGDVVTASRLHAHALILEAGEAEPRAERRIGG